MCVQYRKDFSPQLWNTCKLVLCISSAPLEYLGPLSTVACNGFQLLAICMSLHYPEYSSNGCCLSSGSGVKGLSRSFCVYRILSSYYNKTEKWNFLGFGADEQKWLSNSAVIFWIQEAHAFEHTECQFWRYSHKTRNSALKKFCLCVIVSSHALPKYSTIM